MEVGSPIAKRGLTKAHEARNIPFLYDLSFGIEIYGKIEEIGDEWHCLAVPDEARAKALEIWRAINEKNLYENILPTRQRARLILHKGTDHRIESVELRRI